MCCCISARVGNFGKTGGSTGPVSAIGALKSGLELVMSNGGRCDLLDAIIDVLEDILLVLCQVGRDDELCKLALRYAAWTKPIQLLALKYQQQPKERRSSAGEPYGEGSAFFECHNTSAHAWVCSELSPCPSQTQVERVVCAAATRTAWPTVTRTSFLP